MEIEKKHKKETTWVIKRRSQPGLFVLKAEEQSGAGSVYAIHMKQADKELTFEMNREEFLNYISILNGFKDVVLITEPEEIMGDVVEPDSTSTGEPEINDSNVLTPESKDVKTPPTGKGNGSDAAEKNEGDSDLDPTEWDPF
jgi:hypothetical protein